MYPNDTTQDIPYGFCKCGCGQKTKIASQTSSKYGWIKGEPRHFLSGHNRRQPALPTENKLCECGCGQLAPIAQRTNKAKGHIRGQPCRFIASHNNNIKSPRPIHERFWEKVAKRETNECWEWQAGTNVYGYGLFCTGSRKDGSKRSALANRVSWELTFGPIPDGLEVLHKCDNPPCVNPDHLFLGTQADNMRDMAAKGRGGNQHAT